MSRQVVVPGTHVAALRDDHVQIFKDVVRDRKLLAALCFRDDLGQTYKASHTADFVGVADGRELHRFAEDPAAEVCCADRVVGDEIADARRQSGDSAVDDDGAKSVTVIISLIREA